MLLDEKAYDEGLKLLAEAPVDAVIVDPSFHDGHLEAYAQSFGAGVISAPVRMSDGSARHDPNRLASVFADLMGR